MTVPMTDAMAIRVSKLIAKRIDEINSIASASQALRVLMCMPPVEVTSSASILFSILLRKLPEKKGMAFRHPLRITCQHIVDHLNVANLSSCGSCRLKASARGDVPDCLLILSQQRSPQRLSFHRQTSFCRWRPSVRCSYARQYGSSSAEQWYNPDVVQQYVGIAQGYQRRLGHGIQHMLVRFSQRYHHDKFACPVRRCLCFSQRLVQIFAVSDRPPDFSCPLESSLWQTSS